MVNKVLMLFVLISLDSFFISGQTIHYDYDNSGNRLNRYVIILKSAIIAGKDTLKESKEISKVEEVSDNFGEFTIRIYPNPTQGMISVVIEGLGPDETVEYQLFSQTGLFLGLKRKIGSQFSVDLNQYSNGMYILRLMIKGKMSQWKILKE